MNVCFLLFSPDISGGTNVIFEHATRMLQFDNEVTIVTDDKVNTKRIEWFPGAEKVTWKTYNEVQGELFDLAIATWWKTTFSLHKVKAKKYAYFVQSIESKFYPEEEVILRNLVEQTYTLQVEFITEASWIKEYLFDNYAVNAHLVRNGVRKEYFNEQIEPICKREPNKTRLLIEGPLNVSFKNTELALEIAKKSNADEVWLLTSTPVGAMKGVDKLFSRVPISKVGQIYASCDILVKLSTVEGMFGPPLEAFHCGCTSITYDVTGYDEYIKHSSNALVSFTREDEEVLNFINQLCADKKMIDNLKFEALNTANDWPDWDSSSKVFNDICLNIVSSEVKHNYTSSFKAASLMWDTYWQSVESNKIGNASKYKKIRFKALNYINNNFPNLFFKLRKIKYKIGSYSR
ncbi:glycosyltransferase [Vibrio diazotrophicus]|uniref:glycosyltransferase n=1 Tax=Vibrio diazotrophicus TaxID=685 RepID=UPI003D2F60D6